MSALFFARQVSQGAGLATRLVSSHAADRVLLKGLVFHGYHGVLDEERRLGQKFQVDATLHADLKKAGQSDDLHDTVDYASVYNIIKGIVEGPPRRLIEAVAEDLATAILKDQPLVHSVRVSVVKPHVAVAGVLQGLGVEVVRSRNQHH